MRVLLSFSLLCCSAAFAQDISSGSSALATGQATMPLSGANIEHPYGPTSPAQPMQPNSPVAMLAPLQPSPPGQPGVPLSPTDPEHPTRSPLVVAGDATASAANVVTVRVPGQLQNVTASLNNLFRNLAAAGQ